MHYIHAAVGGNSFLPRGNVSYTYTFSLNTQTWYLLPLQTPIFQISVLQVCPGREFFQDIGSQSYWRVIQSTSCRHRQNAEKILYINPIKV